MNFVCLNCGLKKKRKASARAWNKVKFMFCHLIERFSANLEPLSKCLQVEREKSKLLTPF